MVCRSSANGISIEGSATIEGEGGSPPSDPHKTVDRYFDAVRTRDIGALMSLYAEDAMFTLPNGKSYSGAAPFALFTKASLPPDRHFPSPARVRPGRKGSR